MNKENSDINLKQICYRVIDIVKFLGSVYPTKRPKVK